MERIRFERSLETAAFFSPLAGMEFAEQTIEVRRDPLLGTTAMVTSELATKEEMFFGTTDWAHAEAVARSSREGCFFCPEKVMQTTPRYPEEMLTGGRLARGRALVFPNLFPLAALHAVVTYPGLHFLRPSDFTADLLAEGLGAAVDFARRAEETVADLEHLEVCCNYMLPAGASLAHPHLQVFGGRAVPWLVREAWERSDAFLQRHGVSYWQTLIDEERERGERFVAGRAGVAWLTPFAPNGGREVVAVVPGRARVAALGDEEVSELAAGLSRVIGWYEREGLSAFNFALSGGPRREDAPRAHPVVLRIIARSAFRPDYRADDFFLQKQLGGEVMFDTPEAIAATLREEFGVR